MLNLILHITLPPGIALTNGQVLQKPVTFDVLSAASPFYASVDQVRLVAGPLVKKYQDIAVAMQIYKTSQECNLLYFGYNRPNGGLNLEVFNISRMMWVMNKAARDLLLSISEMQGGPQTHTLANFTFERQKGFETEGLPEKLKTLKEDVAKYEIAVRSGGRIAPGGHVRPRMAAKGVLDFEEKTPSRTWVVTGMGANTQSVDRAGATGGRGKSVKFFASPLFMGPMAGFRFGIYQSLSPLTTGSPYFAGFPLPTAGF